MAYFTPPYAGYGTTGMLPVSHILRVKPALRHGRPLRHSPVMSQDAPTLSRVTAVWTNLAATFGIRLSSGTVGGSFSSGMVMVGSVESFSLTSLATIWFSFLNSEVAAYTAPPAT